MSSSVPPAACFDGVLPPMNLKAATVLITGGSSGIGLGLIKEFLQAGSSVVICGRRESALQAAKNQYPHIKYLVSDVESAEGRIQLSQQIIKLFPQLNILVNNAGIQRTAFILKDLQTPWSESQAEIDINLAAPIHLSTLFIPHLLKQSEAAIINVTSGLAYVPAVAAPIYAATKAALHSYTLSLRVNLQHTNIRVVELIPPAVKSNLGGSHDFGEETDEFCAAVFKEFAEGKLEFGYKMSNVGRFADRKNVQEIMLRIVAQRHPTEKFIPPKS